MTLLCVSACSLNKLTNFNEIWYGRYAIGGHRNLLFLNFLQSVVTT
jgi:hypothetical protein